MSEKELITAIKECEQEPMTLSKINKLANFYIVYDHLFGVSSQPLNKEQDKVEKIIETNGDSDFLLIVQGKKSIEVFKILDELMETVKTLYPKMYDRVLDKLSDL